MRSLVLAIGMTVLSSPALTGPAEPAPTQTTEATEATEATAALLAAACSGCHVSTATETGFPSVYRRPAEEIRNALLAFRSGKRQGTVMNRIAKGYSDAEIGLLSDYLSAQGPDQ